MIHIIKVLQTKKYGINKTEGKTMKKNRKLYTLIILLFLLGCQSKVFEFRVTDSFTGACVIFVENNLFNTNLAYINVNSNLGMINKATTFKKFTFNSIETKEELEIIPIGKTESAEDGKKYIFRLAKGIVSNDCNNNQEIENIVFYVGFKKDYMQWSTQYRNDVFDYLDSIKIDWCKYYNSNKN